MTSSTTDPTPANNSDTETTTVQASADLRVTKTDSPDPVLAGTNLTYTISVDNLGPSDNTGFSLSDTIPAGTSFVSASPACGNVAGTVTCTSAGLVAGTSVSWQIVVAVASSVADATILSNTAAIATNNDGRPGRCQQQRHRADDRQPRGRRGRPQDRHARPGHRRQRRDVHDPRHQQRTVGRRQRHPV